MKWPRSSRGCLSSSRLTVFKFSSYDDLHCQASIVCASRTAVEGDPMTTPWVKTLKQLLANQMVSPTSFHFKSHLARLIQHSDTEDESAVSGRWSPRERRTAHHIAT